MEKEMRTGLPTKKGASSYEQMIKMEKSLIQRGEELLRDKHERRGILRKYGCNKDMFVQSAIPKFDGFYEHWPKLIENFLRFKEYWSMVEEGIPAPPQGRELTAGEAKVIADNQLKDKKVKNYLYQAIDREIMEAILNDGTSKQIWDSMKQKYKDSTRDKRAQLQGLKTEFEMLRMKEGETINVYFGSVLSVAKRMKTY